MSSNEFETEPLILIDDEFCKLVMVKRDSDYVSISFSSTPPFSNPVPDFQWVGVTKYATSFFVIDKTNSWGNNLDWERIALIVNKYTPGKEVHAIGFCMGGSNAILASKYIKIDRVVAFTPQYSIHPDFLTGESYLKQYYEHIDEWLEPSLEGSFSSKTDYRIIFVSNPDDDIQNDAIASATNIIKYDLGEDANHGGPNILGEDMGYVMYEILQGNDLPLRNVIINKSSELLF